MTPGSRFGSHDEVTSPASSLPSSPPSAAMSDNGYHSAPESMRQEEDKLRKQSEQKGMKEREREQQQWEKKGRDDGLLKDLDWFLNRSQVRKLDGLECA